MDRDEVKAWFDRAFQHMNGADFGLAAACFQHVIDNCTDMHVRSIAQRDLHWYCLPLDAVVTQLRNTPRPMTIEELGFQFPDTDTLAQTDYATYLRSVVEALDRVSTVSRLDDDLWVHESHMGVAIQLCLADLRVRNLPTTTMEMAENIIGLLGRSELSPSGHLLHVLRGKLRTIPDVHLLDNDCIFEKLSLDQFLDKLIDIIRQTQKPVLLASVIDMTPWPQAVKAKLKSEALGTWLHGHERNQLIEVADQWWFVADIVDFATAPLDIVFEDQFTPLRSETILRRYLFAPQQPGQLFERFAQLQSKRVAANPTISRVGDDLWLPQETVSAITDQSINVVLKSNWPISLHTLIERLANGRLPDELEHFVVSQIRKDPRIIEVSSEVWQCKKSVTAMVHRAYETLQDSSLMSIDELLATCFGTSPESSHFQTDFLKEFQSALQQDDRFMLFLPQNKWQAVPKGDRTNNLAYTVLCREHRPLSRQQIVDSAKRMPQSGTLAFRLESDVRFRQSADGRWMLASWVVINDLAATYLAQSPIPLLTDTIIRQVCDEYKIDPREAIFTPEIDPRFGSAPFGKWICRSPGILLDATKLEQLTQTAAKSVDGMSLDELIWKTLRDYPTSYYNLEQTLLEDGRLINCNGRWYLRAKWVYYVTTSDLDAIRSYIVRFGYPVPSAVLADACLNRPLCLTNLQTELSSNPDFIELGGAGWIVRGLQPETVGRQRQVNYPVRSGKYSPSISADLLVTGEDAGDDTVDDSVELEGPRVHNIESRHMRRLTITLTFEDIRDGSIVVTSSMRRLLGRAIEYPALKFIDELGGIVSCWHDAANNLLHGFSHWFDSRNLTFGDKIRFSPDDDEDAFHIRPTGERDEQAHAEGIRHSKIQDLLAEAHRVNLSYHDLMIQVLEYFDVPLHIDDLWAMVSSQRAARKRTLVAMISCRSYFKSEGGGYWRFDKEEYARMIRELERQVRRLESDNNALRAKAETLLGQSSAYITLRDENEHLRAHLEALQQTYSQVVGEKTYLEEQVRGLDVAVKQLTEASASLKSALDAQLNRMRSLEQDLANRNADLADMKDRAEQAEIAANQAMRNNQQAETALATSQQALSVFSAQIQDLQGTVTSLEQSREQLRIEATQANEQLRSLSETEERLRERVETAQAALERAGNTLLEVEQRNRDLELSLLQTQIENQKLAQQLVDLQGLHEKLTAEHGEVATILESKKAQIDSMSRSEVELRSHLVDLTTEVRERNEELAIANTKNAELSQAMLQSQADRSDLNRQLARTAQVRDELQQECHQATLELNRVKVQLDEAIRTEAQVRDNFDDLQRVAEETEEKLAVALRHNDDTMLVLDRAWAEKRNLTRKLADLSEHHNALQSESAKAMRVLNTRTGRVTCWWAKARGLELPVWLVNNAH
jgi:hypothetical protein